MNKIIVQSSIAAEKQKVWDYYTMPEHIINWNFASDDWCCPSATNDLKAGGRYIARMEAKDGSFGFDFSVTYTEVIEGKSLSYEFGGRHARITFEQKEGQTEVIITFDPETENSVELQKQGWQAILNNFKKYTESH